MAVVTICSDFWSPPKIKSVTVSIVSPSICHEVMEPETMILVFVYAPTSNAEEAEVEWFFEDLQDLLELTPKKDVLFIIGGWNAKVGSQEIPEVTGKFGLGVQNEARERLIEFCQDNTLVIGNTLLKHKTES